MSPANYVISHGGFFVLVSSSSFEHVTIYFCAPLLISLALCFIDRYCELFSVKADAIVFFVLYKRKGKPKGQSNMENPKKLLWVRKQRTKTSKVKHNTVSQNNE